MTESAGLLETKLYVRAFLTCTALFQRFLYSYMWPYKGLSCVFSPADRAKLRRDWGCPVSRRGCVLFSHGKPHSGTFARYQHVDLAHVRAGTCAETFPRAVPGSAPTGIAAAGQGGWRCCFSPAPPSPLEPWQTLAATQLPGGVFCRNFSFPPRLWVSHHVSFAITRQLKMRKKLLPS